MPESHFNRREINLPQEDVIMADIHGNFSALCYALENVKEHHRQRVGEALINSLCVDSDKDKKLKDMLRLVHREYNINIFKREEDKTHEEKVKDNVKRRLNQEIDAILPIFPEPKKDCLGDFLGYYGQTREVIDKIKTFDIVLKGNHERNILVAAQNLSASPQMLMRFLGISEYAAKSTLAIARQLTPDDIDFLKGLREEAKIGYGAVGRHCYYNSKGRPLYPISKKIAKLEKYFSDEKKIDLYCQDPEDFFALDETFVGDVDWEFVAHSHAPTHTEFDKDKKIIADLAPGKVGKQNYDLASFILLPGHKAIEGVGAVGISRRRDRKITEKANSTWKGVEFRQGYYGSLIRAQRIFSCREFFYDINSKGTLEATVKAGIELRGEDVLQDD